MPQQNFPKSPCYICKDPIADLRSSFIGADAYVNYLKYLSQKNTLEELIKNKKANFINQITFQYFQQFPEIAKNQYQEGGINLGEHMRDKLIDMKAHKYRLEKVLEKAPQDKFLFILAHEECHQPESEVQPYYIDLTRINTAEKAIEWTIHLGEKTWLNYQGWLQILEDLFGRKNT